MSEETPEEKATPGAQRQIDALDHRMRKWTKAIMIVVALGIIGFVLTGWQIEKAFNQQEEERHARVDASASINTFLCQRIDSVGNGVAALVRVSLAPVKDPDELTPTQRHGYNKFLGYAEEQERPPRCKELALKIATLTGADPEDVHITPIQLHHRKPAG